MTASRTGFFSGTVMAGVLLAISGCGGGSSGGGSGGGTTPPATTSLSGTAAVGAAIVSGTVSALCADGSGFTSAVTTAANGSWSGTVPDGALPCVLTVSGGSPAITLRSYASQPGTINITPLTDLTLALATGIADGSWAGNSANWPATGEVEDALDDLIVALSNSGYDLPGTGNPFTTGFVIGDAWDRVLDQIQEAIDASGGAIADYAALVNLIKDGNLDAFPDAPEDEPAPTCEYSAGIAALQATDYDWTFVKQSGSGAADALFVNAQEYAGSLVSGVLTIAREGGQFLEPDIGGFDECSEARLMVNYYGSSGYTNVTLTIEDGEAVVVIGQSNDATNTVTLASVTPAPEPGAELLSGLNGIAFTKGGKTWVLRYADVDGFTFSPYTRNITASNYNQEITITSIDDLDDPTPFNSTSDAVVEANIKVLGTTPGTQLCDANTSIRIQVAGGGDEWTSTECELSLSYNSYESAIEGRIISATLQRNTDTVQLSDGQFRVFMHKGFPGPAPSELPANAWMSMQIDSGTAELAGEQHFIMTRNFSATLNDGSVITPESSAKENITFRVGSDGFFNGPGTYECGTRYTGGTTNVMYMELDIGTYLAYNRYLTKPDGSCSVTIDQREGSLYTGSYTATMISTDPNLNEVQRTVSISGKLRNFMVAAYTAGDGGDEGELPAETRGATLQISDGNTHFTAGERFRLADLGVFGVVNRADFQWSRPSLPEDGFQGGPGQIDLRFFKLPEAAGSYTCNTDYDGLQPYLQLNTHTGVNYGTALFQSGTQSLIEGASCTINVTAVNGNIVEGNYSATVVARNMAPILPGDDANVSMSGNFRYQIFTP